MTVPRCPFCNAQGLDKLAAKNLGYFSLIYCGQCGAIHGVVPIPPKPKTEKQTRPVAYTTPASSPAPEAPPQKKAPLPEEKKAPSPEEEALSYYTRPGQHGFYTRIMADDEES